MSAALHPDGDDGAGSPVDEASTRAARRRVRFAKARAPVAIAMRAVAAAVAMSMARSADGARTDVRAAEDGEARAASFERSVRRSVFMRRVTLGLDAPFSLDAVFGTVGDKDLH